MTNPLSLFQKPNPPVFPKIGIYGGTGSGKTYTSGLIAIGLEKNISKNKPVLMYDTETGSDFLIPIFKKANVELLVVKSRSFVKLLEAVAEAEKSGSVLIIDSIAHVWDELVEAYKTKKGRPYIQINEWGEIKKYWNQFTTAYLNASIPIIMCSRAQDITENSVDESGQKDFSKIGERMKGEKYMGYESSILIRMEALQDLKKKKVRHMAYVEKDRTDTMTGAIVEEPTYESFSSIWNNYTASGEHVGIDSDTSVNHIADPNYNIEDLKRRRTIALEEIQNSITKYIPGRSAGEQKSKLEILETVFGTSSWTKISEDYKAITTDTLEAGLPKVIELAQGTVAVAKPGKKEKPEKLNKK